MRYSNVYRYDMNYVELIIAGIAAVVVLLAASYGWYMLHRRRIRQQQCFDALQITCPVCGAQNGAPCSAKQGATTFLHWPRVTASLQSQQHAIR
jgi:hypothetical protein